MASAGLRDELNCSICLHIYTDPVTLPCDHNFCQSCIQRVIDTQDRAKRYSCPECREEFQQHPALRKNRKLSNIVESFLSIKPDEDKSEIFCSYCVTSSVPAIKTCLHCEASLCDQHVSVHSKLDNHILIEPSACVESMKCSVHCEPLKYFCSEDDICVCVSCCLVGQHKGHNVELLRETAEKKKGNLKNVQNKLNLNRGEVEKNVQSLKEGLMNLHEKANSETKRFTALISNINEQQRTLERQIMNEIFRQEDQLALKYVSQIQQMEKKKDELSKKINKIEVLCNIADPLTVLRKLKSDQDAFCIEEDGENKREEESNVRNEEGDDDDDDEDIDDFDENLMSVTLLTGLAHIVSGVKRDVYGQEATDLLLDVQTAGNYVLLSNDRKTASSSEKDQSRPKNSRRFQDYNQVLSSRSFFSGKYYWEVKGSDSGHWEVGVAYPSIKRQGDESSMGENDRSWCLRKGDEKYSAIHDSSLTVLHERPSSLNIIISLDYKAGRLSFYELGDPIRHLHTFTATFTEPLHAAFSVWENGSMRIVS